MFAHFGIFSYICPKLSKTLNFTNMIRRFIVLSMLCFVSIVALGQTVSIGPFSKETQQFKMDTRHINWSDFTGLQPSRMAVTRGDGPGWKWIDRIGNMPDYLIDFYQVFGEQVKEVMNGGANWLSDPTKAENDGADNYYVIIKNLSGSVDFTAQPDVTWSVTGCTSASEITSYTWEGTPGEATFTKTFDTAQNGYAPTLKVGNADKTVVDVTCTTVKTTKGSEFTFEKQDTKIALPAGESSVEFDLPATWHGSTEGNCTFRCDGANQPITITIGTESSKPDYSATMSIPVAKTINKTAMTITLDVAANCQVGY